MAAPEISLTEQSPEANLEERSLFKIIQEEYGNNWFSKADLFSKLAERNKIKGPVVQDSLSNIFYKIVESQKMEKDFSNPPKFRLISNVYKTT